MDCHLCRRDLTDAITVGTEGRTGPLTSVACRRCGLVQTMPHPTAKEVGDYYASGQYRREFPPLPVFELGEDLEVVRDGEGLPRMTPPDDERYSLMLDRAALRTAKRLADTLKMATHHRVLEVGCGDGRVAAALASIGIDVCAMETDPDKADEARARGVRIIEEGAGFDVVYALQVIEHFADPVGELRTLAERAKVGGLVYVEVPTIERPYVSLAHFFQRPHVVNYSSETLPEAMALAGLGDVQIWIEASVLIGLGVRSADPVPAPEWQDTDERGLRAAAILGGWEQRRLAKERAQREQAKAEDRMGRFDRGEELTAEERLWVAGECKRFRDGFVDAVEAIRLIIKQLESAEREDWHQQPWARGFLAGRIYEGQQTSIALGHVLNTLMDMLNREPEQTKEAA